MRSRERLDTNAADIAAPLPVEVAVEDSMTTRERKAEQRRAAEQRCAAEQET